MLRYVVFAFAVLLAPVPDEPEPIDLFSKEGWYKDQAGKEQDFVGVLTKIDQPAAGFGRFNPYRLVLDGDKKETREVYIGGKPDLLKSYVSKKVKIVGKAVDMEVEGRMHREIWPARLLVLDGEKVPPKPRRIKILQEHKLYAKEPGTVQTFEGVLRKEEKGGFVLEMKSAREELTLYPETDHLLTPFVGQSVRIVGKQVTGLVGNRKFQHTLPGTLEILEVEPEDGPADRGKLEHDLAKEKRMLTASLERFKEIQKILANIQNATPDEVTQARRDELKVKNEVERAAKRVRELQEQLLVPQRQP